MRVSTTVVFCSIDDLIPVLGRPLTGFPTFLDALSEAGIPCVWVTSRNRHELDPLLRRLGHAAPFIAEGGSGVYLPADYFHLKASGTIRLGRFMCIPIAARQPAAKEALEALAADTGVTVVPLRSLSSRELMQNTGLPKDAAELLLQRDFDELFFFAGASEQDIRRFRERAMQRRFSTRPRGSLWSLAAQANVASCVRELRKLYDRAWHAHSFSVGVTAASLAQELLPACDRGILLTDRSLDSQFPSVPPKPAPTSVPLFTTDTWTQVLEAIQTRRTR